MHIDLGHMVYVYVCVCVCTRKGENYCIYEQSEINILGLQYQILIYCNILMPEFVPTCILSLNWVI